MTDSVQTLDRGLKTDRRGVLEKSPASDESPLSLPAMVPADASAYFAVRYADMDGLFGLLTANLRQQKAALERMREQFEDDPAMLDRQEKTLDALLNTVEKKLSPHLRGETGAILGPPAAVSIRTEDVKLRDLPIPTFGFLIRSDAPKTVLDGIRELLAALVPTPEGRWGRAPVRLVRQDLEGVEAHFLLIEGFRVEGFQPHFAIVGKHLLFSTSADLTGKIASTAAARAPSILTTAYHKSMSGYLPAEAAQASYVDGSVAIGHLKRTADGILRAVEENPRGLGISASDARRIGRIRGLVEDLFRAGRCFKGSAGSIVREGKIVKERGWLHIEDVE